VPGLTSVAVTVVTAVMFSASEMPAVVPPPFDVITGAAFSIGTPMSASIATSSALGCRLLPRKPCTPFMMSVVTSSEPGLPALLPT
jgi:hypothetical protein